MASCCRLSAQVGASLVLTKPIPFQNREHPISRNGAGLSVGPSSKFATPAVRAFSKRPTGRDPAMSASEDQTVQRGIALPALSSNQMSLAAIVILLGVSYMFNSMVRQVFPALLSAISPHHGPTLPQAGLVSAIFTVTVAIFGALSGWFKTRFGREASAASLTGKANGGQAPAEPAPAQLSHLGTLQLIEDREYVRGFRPASIIWIDLRIGDDAVLPNHVSSRHR
jgi:hypothetical protein